MFRTYYGVKKEGYVWVFGYIVGSDNYGYGTRHNKRRVVRWWCHLSSTRCCCRSLLFQPAQSRSLLEPQSRLGDKVTLVPSNLAPKPECGSLRLMVSRCEPPIPTF